MKASTELPAGRNSSLARWPIQLSLLSRAPELRFLREVENALQIATRSGFFPAMREALLKH
jgi:hypothetical protein